MFIDTRYLPAKPYGLLIGYFTTMDLGSDSGQNHKHYLVDICIYVYLK